MSREYIDKKQKLLITLLTEMFKRVGREYKHSITKDPDWYLTSTWTSAQQDDFAKWGTKQMQRILGLSAYSARNEMGWFLLSYGWLIKQEEQTDAQQT